MSIFAFDFMNRAMLAGAVVGLVAPSIGLFLVLRRMSVIGDALAHVSLAGLATGLLLKIYPIGTALGFALAAGVGIDRLREAYRRHGDLAVAIMLSTSIGLAAVLFSMEETGAGVFTYLFGSIFMVTGQDLLTISVLGALVLAVVLALYKELFFITFDDELAQISGLPVRWLNSLFMLLTAVTVVVTMRVVGTLLVSSLMVLPVAAALQVARSFRAAFLLAIGFAELTVVAGLVLAYYLDLAPGGTIVLTGGVLLVTVLAVRKVLARRLAEVTAETGTAAGRTCR